MEKGSRTAGRFGARALVLATVAAGGVAAVASPAYAALPTITSVYVAGSTTNKVVTAGSTVVITGTGFGGMVDNSAVAGCTSNTPVAWPTANSGCSQVRFLGVNATSTAGFTLATRYTVVSDTTIYATVPTIATVDGTTTGSIAAGTGAVKVQVLNTTGTGTSSLLSASTASEIYYRAPLTAVITGLVNANPLGGGALTVGVTGVASLTSTTFPQEKISAYVTSTVASSPQVAPASVAFKDTTNVTVVLPPGGSTGDLVSVMLVHDGVAGTADSDSLKYPAVITEIKSCAADTSTFISTPSTTFPTCTGTANAPTSGSADFKITGKGLSGATAWSFDGTGGSVAETCLVVSDTSAYCHIVVTTPPTSGVAPVTFTPAAVGSSAAPTLVPTAGGIVLYSTLV